MIKTTFGMIVAIIALLSCLIGLASVILAFPWGIYHFFSAWIDGQNLWLAAFYSLLGYFGGLMAGFSIGFFGFRLCFLFKKGYIQ